MQKPITRTNLWDAANAKPPQRRAHRRQLLRWAAEGAALMGAVVVGHRTRELADAAQADGLVGSWLLTFTIPAASFATLATFHADGTLIKGGAPAEAGPPGSGIARLFLSTGHGSWTRLSGLSSGDQSVAYTFVELTFDDVGTALGSNKVRGELTPDATGAAASGPFRFEVLSPDGSMLHTETGTVTARRIGVESL